MQAGYIAAKLRSAAQDAVSRWRSFSALKFKAVRQHQFSSLRRQEPWREIAVKSSSQPPGRRLSLADRGDPRRSFRGSNVSRQQVELVSFILSSPPPSCRRLVAKFFFPLSFSPSPSLPPPQSLGLFRPRLFSRLHRLTQSVALPGQCVQVAFRKVGGTRRVAASTFLGGLFRWNREKKTKKKQGDGTDR